MAAPKYVIFNPTTGLWPRQTAVQTGGLASAEQIVATDAAGLIDASLLPPGLVSALSIVPSEAIANGALVNIYYDVGAAARRIRNARADYNVVGPVYGRTAHGFVLVGGAGPGALTVYTDGKNVVLPMDVLAAGDEGKPVYVSDVTPGRGSLTPPTATKTFVQKIGVVGEVVTAGTPGVAIVDFTYGLIIENP